MPPIVHTVLLDLDPALPRETAEAVEALRALVSLPGVRSMTVGPDVSPEGLGDGFTHAAVAVLQQCLRRVTVVDVEAG
jgi:hypothetical protein